MKLNICHLYPDILNLYGDSGNIRCLEQRLAWRGIEYETTRLPMGVHTDLSKFDLFYIGGGLETELGMLLDDLIGDKAQQIIAAVEDEKVFFCVGSGFQLMGQYISDREGVQQELIGALNMYTLASPERHVGNFMFRRVDDFTGSVVVGYECHSGMTILGEGVSPFGEVFYGFGNNGADRSEGARYKKVYGTNALGPVLPKNPELADSILHSALLRSNPNIVLNPINDFLEQTAHDYMANRLMVN